MEEKEKDQLIQTKLVSSKGILDIGHISDLHNKHKKVTVPTCDILICSGDISGMGNRSEVEPFFKWFKQQTQATYKVLIAGNHDITFDPKKNIDGCKPEWLIEAMYDLYMRGCPNNYYLENESVDIMGIKIWGSPYSSWFNGDTWGFNVHRGKESRQLYSTIPLGTDILVTHGPPFGKNDWCRDIASPVGCEDLIYHVKRVKPLLHLYGHIHESYGYCYDADTNYFNGAICNLSYKPVNAPWLIKADFDNKEIKILNE